MIGLMEIVLGGVLVYFCGHWSLAGIVPLPWLGWAAIAFGVVLVSFPDLVKFEK
jgi:hypothetical protein